MKRALVLDLETTSVDIASTEVVQCALLEVALPSWTQGDLWSKLANPGVSIPTEATEVHNITDDQVRDLPHFAAHAAHVEKSLDAADLLVTFNGAAFDIPIVQRVINPTCDIPHLDVYRIWQVARDQNIPRGLPRGHHELNTPRAKRFTGALGSMFAWLTANEPDLEHDAGADCRMTASGAAMLTSHYGLDQCLAWSSGPLPGFVDFESKIRWTDRGAVLAFSKYKGETLYYMVNNQRGFLVWMLRNDFHADTKKIIRAALDGRLPTR